MTQQRLLLVDPDPVSRNTLQAAFIRKGWEVAMVATPAEGSALLIDYDPHWIILSSTLSDGDGQALLRKVGLEKAQTRVAVILPPKDSSRAAQLAGFHVEHVLTWPVTPEVVYELCDSGRGCASATG